jgi:regulator of replication initiation timing
VWCRDYEVKEKKILKSLEELKKHCEDLSREISSRTQENLALQGENKSLGERLGRAERRKKEVTRPDPTTLTLPLPPSVLVCVSV